MIYGGNTVHLSLFFILNTLPLLLLVYKVEILHLIVQIIRELGRKYYWISCRRSQYSSPSREKPGKEELLC